MPWFIAIPLLGGANGLRTMTPIAVLCWFAYTGHLPVNGSWAAWTGNAFSVVTFTLLAIGEWIGDKLPTTPNRIDIFPLVARGVFGAGVGAVMASTLFLPLAIGALLGAVSAVAGAFLGFRLRRSLTSMGKVRDFPIALMEDVVAVGLSFLAIYLVA